MARGVMHVSRPCIVQQAPPRGPRSSEREWTITRAAREESREGRDRDKCGVSHGDGAAAGAGCNSQLCDTSQREASKDRDTCTRTPDESGISQLSCDSNKNLRATERVTTCERHGE